MRIVTWNCARGPLAVKLDALHRLNPDVVVLCEAPAPANESSTVAWFPAGASKLGVQVRAYGDYVVERLQCPELPHCVNPVRINGATSFNLLAVWTWPAPSYVKALLNGLDAYTDLLESGPTVVAGDFNGNPVHDKPRQLVKWGHALARLNEHGLVSAYHESRGIPYGAEPDSTHLHLRKSDRPFHIDFCFVPREWTAANLSVRIEAAEPWPSLSDHRPIVVDVAPA